MGSLVQRLAQDVRGVPLGEVQNRHLELRDAWQLVELHPKDPLRAHPLAEQCLDDLVHQDRLPHLPGAPQNHGGRQPLLEMV